MFLERTAFAEVVDNAERVLVEAHKICVAGQRMTNCPWQSWLKVVGMERRHQRTRPAALQCAGDWLV